MNQPDQNRAALLADALRAVSGVVLLTALFVAPLNYGSTRLLPFETLIALTAASGAAWLLSGACAGSWSLPPIMVRVGLGLLTVSAVAWLTALPVPELPDFTQAHFARVAARWPHSVVPRDMALLIAWSATATVSLVALIDLARDLWWRRSIAAVMLLTGATAATLGLLQNATRAPGIFWEGTVRMPGAFFGPFFHHTAAGAYLNTVWPVGLGLALAYLQRDQRSPRGHALILVSLAAVVLLLAAHAAHVSRLPQVVAMVALIGFVVWAGVWRTLGRMRGLRLALTAAVLVAAIGTVTLGASRIGTISARWNQLQFTRLAGGEPAVAQPGPAEWRRLMRDDLFVPSDHRQYPLGDRGAAYAAALAAIAERPWFGWGPGGWIAGAAAHSVDPFVRTFFLYLQFTHNDLLQTAVEWGLVGTLGWVLLVPAALGHGVRRLGRDPSHDYVGTGAVIALGAVLVQSTIDFPLQIPAVQFNAIALAALAWSIPLARTPAVGVSPFSSS